MTSIRQRYQIEAVDYPEPGLNVVGWSSGRASAERMARGVLLAPSCAGAWVKDTETGESWLLNKQGES